MAIGGMSLYRGGKAVLKNPAVRNAVSNTVNISRATIKDAIQANRGSTILGSNLGGYGGQLYSSLKKVRADRKELREGIVAGKSCIIKLSENINSIKLRRIDRKETTISQIEQNKLIRELSNTPDNEIITSYKETITNRVSTSKEVKKLNEWLSDDEKLLTEVANWYREKPEWWGIDPDNTDVFYRTPDEVKEISKKKKNKTELMLL